MEQFCPGVARFGAFELDCRAGELRKHGLKLKLQGKPLDILALLIQHPGEVVTREELREKLWPPDTFVDFDHSLNTAVNKLREALGDSAENPRFIETLHRRGYRFIAPVERLGPSSPPHLISAKTSTRPRRPALLRYLSLAVIALGGGVAFFLAFKAGGWPWTLLGINRPGPIQSLAVLPLVNLSGDPEQEYFADGVTEALISNLTRIGRLRVISRTSAIQYKGARKSSPQIARELRVQALIEGTVLRHGERVRITAQLVDGVTDSSLWSGIYQREIGDILALQSEVAQAIAREIFVELTPQEKARLASSSRVDPEAYQAYLKGRYYWTREPRKGSGEGSSTSGRRSVPIRATQEPTPDWPTATTCSGFITSFHTRRPFRRQRRRP